MANIPASNIVNVTPGVLSAGGDALDLNGLILTNSTRVPIGSVLEFGSTDAVADYFGPASAEALIAPNYFLGFDNSTKKPGAVLFAQYPTAAVAAYLRGGDAAAVLTLAQLQALGSGTVIVTVDGLVRTSATINLSGATSFSNAAALITTGLNTTPPTPAVGTASIATTTMTVTAMTSGAYAPGMLLTGSGVTAGTHIVAQLAGTAGGIGTYSVDTSQTASSTTITGSSVAVTATFDSVSGAFVITSGITGVNSTIGYATGSLATGLLLTAATGAVLSQGSAIAVPATFMAAVTASTQNWAGFTHMFNPDVSGNANKLLFAAWTNSTGNRYWYVPWDTDITPTQSTAATGSLGYLIGVSDYSGTTPIYAPDATYTVAALGYMASIDFTATQGRATMKFRSQTGLTPYVTNLTVATNLIANGYTFYGSWATADDQFNFFADGNVSGPFQWADSYLNQIWLNNALQLAGMSGLTQAKSVPYNQRGYSTVYNWFLDPIQAAVNFGAIQSGVTLSEAQKTYINTAAGQNVDRTMFNTGWYLQIKNPTAQVRQARGSPVCNLFYVDGQSIQVVDLSSVLVQ